MYDPFARRIRKTVTDTTGQGTTTLYQYSDEGLIAESDAAGQIKVMYGWLPDNSFMTEPQTIAVNGQTYFYHNDHLGTPQTVTDAAGTVVWAADMGAFGGMNITTQTIVSNLRFPGQYYDQESGLSYNWHRYYDAVTGRYVEADPIGLEGGINRWGYVYDLPTNMVDSWGLMGLPPGKGPYPPGTGPGQGAGNFVGGIIGLMGGPEVDKECYANCWVEEKALCATWAMAASGIGAVAGAAGSVWSGGVLAPVMVEAGAAIGATAASLACGILHPMHCKERCKKKTCSYR